MRHVLGAVVAALAITVLAAPAQALLKTVVGPSSTAGVFPAIIGAPANILDDIVTNTAMQGFNEAQGVTTTVAHSIDGGGAIAAGTRVNSHMIFLNSVAPELLAHGSVFWFFNTPIIGIMSDSGGTLEAASTFELGNPATNYTATVPGSGPAPPFALRGLEGNNGTGLNGSDGYQIIDPAILKVSMVVSEPGDWIRVVTAVPEPASLAIFGLGVLALGILMRRRRTAA